MIKIIKELNEVMKVTEADLELQTFYLDVKNGKLGTDSEAINKIREQIINKYKLKDMVNKD